MQTTQILIETPRNFSEKYAWHKETGFFLLKKALPLGMMFPFDFGIIPGTEGEDGDPLDALVVSEFESYPGCLMECRLIGAMLATQSSKGKKIRNDRFFYVPVVSRRFANISALNQLPKGWVEEIKSFFIQYNHLEGKQFNVIKLLNAKSAYKLTRA